MGTHKGFQGILGILGLFVTALVLAATPAGAQTTVNANWTGGVSNWTTASNWSCNCIPNNSSANVFNVTILNVGPTNVSLDDTSSLSSITVNTLSLGTNLTIADGESLTAAEGFSVVNTFNSGGSITIYGQSVAGTQSLLSVGAATPTTLTDLYLLYGGTSGAAVEYGNGGITQIGEPGSNYITSVGLYGPNAYLELSSAPGSNSALAGLKTIANGSLTLADGASAVTTGPLTNNGGISLTGALNAPNCGSNCLSGGSLAVGGNLSNTGTISVGAYVYGSTLSVSGDLTNSGTISVVSGSPAEGGTASVVDVMGNFTNSGEGKVDIGIDSGGAGGTVNVAGTYTQTSGSTDVSGTLMAAGGVNITGGTVSGENTMDASVINGGAVSPGDLTSAPTYECVSGPPCFNTLTINGDYTQKIDGTLLIDIASASDYSILDVSGEASLDGTVDFDFLNGYVPGTNTDFAFLQAGSVLGDFASVDISGITCPTCTLNLSTLSLDTGNTPPTPPPVPEPGTLILFGTGLLASFFLLHRKSRGPGSKVRATFSATPHPPAGRSRSVAEALERKRPSVGAGPARAG